MKMEPLLLRLRQAFCPFLFITLWSKVFAVPGHETTGNRFEQEKAVRVKYRTDKEMLTMHVENNWLSADEMNILRSIEAKQTKYYGTICYKSRCRQDSEEYYNWVLQAVDSARACYNEYPALSEKIRILTESNIELQS